jgi:hypothetical protein
METVPAGSRLTTIFLQRATGAMFCSSYLKEARVSVTEQTEITAIKKRASLRIVSLPGCSKGNLEHLFIEVSGFTGFNTLLAGVFV